MTTHCPTCNAPAVFEGKNGRVGCANGHWWTR